MQYAVIGKGANLYKEKIMDSFIAQLHEDAQHIGVNHGHASIAANIITAANTIENFDAYLKFAAKVALAVEYGRHGNKSKLMERLREALSMLNDDLYVREGM
jgi:hypothetical protein